MRRAQNADTHALTQHRLSQNSSPVCFSFVRVIASGMHLEFQLPVNQTGSLQDDQTPSSVNTYCKTLIVCKLYPGKIYTLSPKTNVWREIPKQTGGYIRRSSNRETQTTTDRATYLSISRHIMTQPSEIKKKKREREREEGEKDTNTNMIGTQKSTFVFQPTK